jgi:low temperature requirement protein LtrA
MKPIGARTNLLRVRAGHSRVTFVELFFDLVFVFAVTQLSHLLLEHFDPLGVLQTALLLIAVWWVWIYNAWVTNWLDPQTTPVRMMLFVQMLAGLVLSTSIPQAFESRGLAFAAAYAFMQVGRCLFMLWSLRHHHAGNFRNYQRITAWLALAAVFWIAGGLTDSGTRLAFWTVAMLIELAAPAAGFWTPRLGRSSTTDWDIEGTHIAERCGLFVIIALGESILVTGATFSKMAWTPLTVAAFAVAFVGSVAMWWIYFNIGAERGSKQMAHSDDPGRLGRLYTYIHLLLVAGIIVAAAADELVLAHPDGHLEWKTAGALLGGPALFLLGNLLFKRTQIRPTGLSHMVGLALLAALIPLAPFASPLAFAAAATLVLVTVAIWETRSLGGKPARAADHASLETSSPHQP